jgi:hypothetical protein
MLPHFRCRRPFANDQTDGANETQVLLVNLMAQRKLNDRFEMRT